MGEAGTGHGDGRRNGGGGGKGGQRKGRRGWGRHRTTTPTPVKPLPPLVTQLGFFMPLEGPKHTLTSGPLH